jgi:hypothetical protein
MAIQPDEVNRWEFALTGCKHHIGIQRAFIQMDADGSLPERAMDQLSLGYLSGFVDQWMQACSVENESLCMTALAQVLEEVFGSNWESCLRAALLHMRSRNAPFINGMSLGANDAFENIKSGVSEGGSIPRMTWAQYVSTGLHSG